MEEAEEAEKAEEAEEVESNPVVIYFLRSPSFCGARDCKPEPWSLPERTARDGGVVLPRGILVLDCAVGRDPAGAADAWANRLH